MFTAVPVLFIMYTNKDSNLIKEKEHTVASQDHSTPALQTIAQQSTDLTVLQPQVASHNYQHQEVAHP